MKTKLFAMFIVFTMIVSMSFVISAAPEPVNLIKNGDFESGNDGQFDSDYQYIVENPASTTELWDPHTYGIGIDPYLYHNLWTSYSDHSDPGSLMMIVNASDQANSGNDWQQDVDNLTCERAYSVTSKQLIADNGAWDAGEVEIKYNPETGKISVRMVTDGERDGNDGWLIYGMKVHIAVNCAGIPQKKGNPIPGSFANKFVFADGVLDTGFIEMIGTYGPDTQVCIAAHADLKHAEVLEQGHTEYNDFCVVSGVGTDLALGGSAALAWGPNDPWGSVDTNVNNIPDCLETTAGYVWDAQWVTPTVADLGGLVEFVQDFDIDGIPTSAILKIAADNSFAFNFNDGAETYRNLVSGWRDLAEAGDFSYPSVIIDPSPTGWQQVYEFDVLSQLLEGANTFNVTGLNANWDTTSPTVNPAMVIYKLCGTSEKYVVDVPYEPYEDETGWGEGHEFEGSNWGMCIEYTPEYVCDYGSYTLEFWAANSYDGNQADLNVMINDISIGHADLSEKVGEGVWKKYSFTWENPGVPSADISIVNTINIYGGDDFALDDMSFIKNP